MCSDFTFWWQSLDHDHCIFQKIRIYDSLNTQLPDSTKKQIASLIFTEEKSIELEYINVCVSYYNINYA